MLQVTHKQPLGSFPRSTADANVNRPDTGTKMILTLLETVHGIDHVILATVATAGALLLLYLWPRHDALSVPLINDREGIDLFYTKAKNRFIADAEGLIKAGFAKVSTRATLCQFAALMPPPTSHAISSVSSPTMALGWSFRRNGPTRFATMIVSISAK